MSNTISQKIINNSDFAIITNNYTITKKWLWLGIFALAVAGMLSIALVLARVPFINSLFPGILAFKTILIVHVNLSILVWLLAITASIWCKYIHQSLYFIINQLNYVAWLGVILMIISIVIPGSLAVSNNYVPILHNMPFISGLACFASSILCLSVIIFISYVFNYLSIIDDLLILASSSFITIVTALCLQMSYSGLAIHINKFTTDLHFFYELLFWGGGHILQFLYSQMISYVWLILASKASGFSNTKNISAFCFALNGLFVIPAILLYWFVHIDEPLYTEFFTLHMRYLGGVVPMMIVSLILWQIFTNKTKNFTSITSDFYQSALVTSIIIFVIGGLMGLCIAGTSVTIPAHYHGSIVGISIGFMGYTYHYIASNYVNSPLKNNIQVQQQAVWQIIIYGVGQFIHVGGLFIAGGYGAMRKTPGEEIAIKAKLGMIIMGIGGLLAIIGGLMFIVICVKNSKIIKTTIKSQK